MIPSERKKLIMKQYRILNAKSEKSLLVGSIIIMLMLLHASCKKLVEINAPPNYVTGDNVYTTDASAAAVLTGIYTNLSEGYIFSTGASSLSIQSGLSSDELTLYNGSTNTQQLLFYTNSLNSQMTETYWTFCYKYLLSVNSAIEGLSGSNKLSGPVKQQLLGEAKFLRSFFYFYLVNLYGDVPLILSSNYPTNALLPRTKKELVYQQIIMDLTDAKNLLNTNYLDASVVNKTDERVRPTKWAAIALLARVYLFSGDFVHAEEEATSIINYKEMYSLSALSDVFLKNSSEAIWQLQPVNSGWNTEDARVFILPATGPNESQFVYASDFLLKAFEANDLRRTNWIDSLQMGSTTYYYPFKYKSAISGGSVTEYLMVMRLAEQYLIRAEAKTQQGDISRAQDDLNVVRNRAGLQSTSAATKNDLLTSIQHERQVELFCEWGQRWLDLKRTGTLDSVMEIVGPLKGATWNTYSQLYPVPLYDLQHNPSLTQNPGY
jgi:hypothetical protein